METGMQQMRKARKMTPIVRAMRMSRDLSPSAGRLFLWGNLDVNEEGLLLGNRVYILLSIFLSSEEQKWERERCMRNFLLWVFRWKRWSKGEIGCKVTFFCGYLDLEDGQTERLGMNNFFFSGYSYGEDEQREKLGMSNFHLWVLLFTLPWRRSR